MNQQSLEILHRHWGYREFKGIQAEIIQCVLSGEDTLALMPTGGGKSVCYQVPALMRDGLCLVISPLIALMHDQVLALRQKSITAHALTSEMHPKEIDVVILNCLNDRKVKFLYASPERLRSESFVNALKNMPVNLIAVDEAHCISMWGYDFRPPYLQIADIRDHHPNVPIIALTATATEQVADDIQKRLRFKKSNMLRMSFERQNLTYAVVKGEDKLKTIGQLLKSVKGSVIIYADTRRRVRELAGMFGQARGQAVFYHAGLTAKEKTAATQSWMSGKVRIMTATNAFGMGIDKPDVRLVVHYNAPGSPEAYFQEAGRAGRDGLKSYAVLLYENKDLEDVQSRIALKYPPTHTLIKVYSALCNQCQVAYGAGEGIIFPVNMEALREKSGISGSELHHALVLLQRASYIVMQSGGSGMSKVRCIADRNSLYDFRLRQLESDGLLLNLLRGNESIFDNYTDIDEAAIGRVLNLSAGRVQSLLEFCMKSGILDYQRSINGPRVLFPVARIHGDRLLFPDMVFKDRLKVEITLAAEMANYCAAQTCRSQLLLSYFGEKISKSCGDCDVCRGAKISSQGQGDYEKLSRTLDNYIATGAVNIEALLRMLPISQHERALDLIRWKLDNAKWTKQTTGEFSSSVISSTTLTRC